MVKSISDMVEKGKNKYASKISQMEKNYEDMQSEAVSRFKDLPFGRNFTQAYENAMGHDAAQAYKDSIDSSSADKWAENWKAKVSK